MKFGSEIERVRAAKNTRKSWRVCKIYILPRRRVEVLFRSFRGGPKRLQEPPRKVPRREGTPAGESDNTFRSPLGGVRGGEGCSPKTFKSDGGFAQVCTMQLLRRRGAEETPERVLDLSGRSIGGA